VNAPLQDPSVTGGQTNAFSIGAIVCGLIAVVIFPIVFGPIGIVLGAIAKSRQEPKANLGLAIAVGGMLVGFLVGALVFAAND
jgi:hypothetical protein